MDGKVTVSTMHQRLRDDHGTKASESSLRRYIRATFAEQVARQAVVVLRDTPPPGEEAQVDYRFLGRWFDPERQRTRRAWGFLMTLCFSRMLFLRPVLTMDEATWVACHVAAFEFFGGATRRVVCDNLKTGVVKADLHDPLINRAFGEFAAHYETLIDRPGWPKPRDKRRIERPVPYARDSFFAGRAEEFSDLAGMQAAALRWSAEVANRRQCRPLGRVAPAEVFEAEGRACLLPLPARPLEIAAWSSATVHPDIHVKAGSALYSVPWTYVGKEVDIREGQKVVEVFCQGSLVKIHVRIEREADRLRRLPTGEDRLLHAHPDLVPSAGEGTRAPYARSSPVPSAP